MEKYFKEELQKVTDTDIDNKIEKFNIYFKELVDYNEKVNLTSITEKNEVFEKHFIDSFLPSKFIKDHSTVCDIGTGAGFPSIPLAIINQTLKIYAVDSLNKRIEFLNMLNTKLDLKNVQTFHSRAEDFAKNYRESFDYCVSRAVSKLNTLLEYCLPLVKIGGYMLAYKSLNYEEEIKEAQKALNILGGKIEKILDYDLVKSEQKRYIIVIKKIKATPKSYPRNQNKPKSHPIK
ncbi:MAG: 16S rRNA (guanine(527)-N(7))-methyltransferase RsmG [Clostridia bacterium]|nr:16S rRNA (guanine(527)-N(7))-methyltransferase RsmG [Clostridia bacterium]